MVDYVTPITFSTPTTLFNGDKFIDGGGPVTIDGTTVTIDPGAIIDWDVNAGTNTLQFIRFLNGGVLNHFGVGTAGGFRAEPTSGSDRSYWSHIDFTNAGSCTLIDVNIINSAFGYINVGEGHILDGHFFIISGGGFGTPAGVIALALAGGEFRAQPTTVRTDTRIINCDSGISVSGAGIIENISIEPDVVGTRMTHGSPVAGNVLTVRHSFFQRGTIEVDLGPGSLIFEDLELQAGAAIGGIADVIGKPWIDVNFSGNNAVFTIDGFTYDNPGVGATEYIDINSDPTTTATFNFFGFDVRFGADNSGGGTGAFFLDVNGLDPLTNVRIGDGHFKVRLNDVAAGAIAAGPGTFDISQVLFGDPDDTDAEGMSAFLSVGAGVGQPVNIRNCIFYNHGKQSTGNSANAIQTIRRHALTVTGCTFFDNGDNSIVGQTIVSLGGGTLIFDTSQILSTRNAILIRGISISTGGDHVVRNSFISLDVQASNNNAIQWNTTAGGSLLVRNSTILNTGAFISGTSGIEARGFSASLKEVFLFQSVIEAWEIGFSIVDANNYGGLSDCTTYKLNEIGIQVTYNLNFASVTFLTQFSNFEGNTVFGFNNPLNGFGQGATLDARFCYWNTTDGPSGAGPGTGDAISARILFDPFNVFPCDNFGILIGGNDVRDFAKGVSIDRMLNGAAKVELTVEDFDQSFTRADFEGRPLDIIIGSSRVLRTWIQVVDPVYRGAGVRDFRLVAYDSIGWARLRKVPDFVGFNYTNEDPAQIFRDMIDLLNVFVPGTTLTYDSTSVPDSLTRLTRDYRDEMIYDVIDDVLAEIGQDRAFWIDGDLVAHFRGEATSAEILSETEVDEMTNPADLLEMNNRITLIYDSGTNRVVPKPRNFDTIARLGVRDSVLRRGSITADSEADARAAAELQKKGAVLQDIRARIDLDFFRFELRDVITVNVPIMELDNIEKEVTHIRHEIASLIDGANSVDNFQFGETWLTLGAQPIRMADYWRGLLTQD